MKAKVDPTTVIEAAAVVQEGAKVGRKCHIGSSSVVGPGVTVGDKTWLENQVSLQYCRIGSGCILHSGAKIGGRGFVFRPADDGSPFLQEKDRQAFQVEIRDKVVIGANTVVDRGSWRDTVIDKGAKLDSLVQIGHDSNIGRGCIICSHASVGASSSLGDDVIVGNRAAIKDHVSIAAKTRIAAKSGVVQDVVDAGDYAGHPAMPAHHFKHQVATSRSGKGSTGQGHGRQSHVDEFDPAV